MRTGVALRPISAPPRGVTLRQVPLVAGDGTVLGLTRAVADGPGGRPAVLLLHGHTASSEMFVLPEIRNLVDALLDDGYDPWLLDWRGSCRLPYNTGRDRYSYDDVAVYDIPAAVAAVRKEIDGRPLFVVAHCIGALCLSLSLTAGLLPGLAGVVAQGVFLTPKAAPRTKLLMHLGGELMRSRWNHMPIDFAQVGLRSRYTPVFAWASRGADCKDPTCQILHNNAWGMGGSLYVHDNLHPYTHDRLARLFGAVPLWVLPHLRRMELAHSVMRWNDNDRRYACLPENAVDRADAMDAPLLLISGSENRIWPDSMELTRDVLVRRFPQLDVTYHEIPGYGHVDPMMGRGAALDVFGHILEFLGSHR